MFTQFLLLIVLLGIGVLSAAHAQGPKTPAPASRKVARITVVGNTHVATDDILERLNRKRAIPPDASGTDAERMVDAAAVQDMGLFQSVKVTGAPDPAGGIDITCTVVENPIVRAIEITANTPDGKPTITAATLIARMHIPIGQVLNTKTLAVDVNDLFNPETGFLRAQGYFCAASPDPHVDPATGVLKIHIMEAYVDTIKVQGNGSVPAADVLAALGLKPGDLLDFNAVHQGLRRVERMHRFAASDMLQATQVQPGKVAVTVPVRVPRPPFGTLAAEPQMSVAVEYGGPVGGFPVVPVRVNDRRAGHFLLVTNTDLSEISTEFADALGLKPQLMIVGGLPYVIDGTPASAVALDRLTLGGIPGVDVRELSLPVINLSEISKQMGQPIDGILGADLLSRLTVGIDFPRRCVTFWNHGHLSDAERHGAGFGDGVEMPWDPAYALLPMPAIAAQIQNGSQTKAASILIATGSQTSLLPGDDVEALGMTPLSNPDDPATVLVRAAHLRFGSLSIGEPLFQRNDVDTGTTFGLNALSLYRVLLDGPARAVRFAPEVTVSGGDPRRMSWAVPFQFDHLTTPLPVVQVSIDGHPPLPFLFDTGTTAALTIDREAARVLGLTIDGASAGMINVSIPVQTAPVATAVLQGRTPGGNMTVSLEQAIINDLSLLHDSIVEPRIAGIIGSGMLQNMAVRFDFGNRLLTFSPVPDSSLRQEGPPSIPGTRVLPLSEGVTEGLYFAAFTPASGKPIRMEVDSGADGTSLPYEIRMALDPIHSAINGYSMLGFMGLGQRIRLSAPPLAEIPSGALSIDVEATSDAFPQPTLGVDILSRVTATLDIPRMQLRLASPPMPISPTYSGWVGARLEQGKSGFRITQALPKSPGARAGLKAGDVLLAVDGRSLQGLSLFSVRTLVNGLAGTPAAFVIRRGNKPPQTIRFRRADVSGDPPSPLNGVYGRRAGPNPFMVEGIVPGSLADRAGITAGDTITAINGKTTPSLTASQWQTLLLLTRLTLTVSRDGASRTVILTDPAP